MSFCTWIAKIKWCIKKVRGKDKTVNIFVQNFLFTYFVYNEVDKLGERLALVHLTNNIAAPQINIWKPNNRLSHSSKNQRNFTVKLLTVIQLLSEL